MKKLFGSLALALLCLVYLTHCGKSGSTPENSFTVPEKVVGFWTNAKGAFTLNDSILRIDESGKLERVAPNLPAPVELGTFTSSKSLGRDKIEMRLKVHAKVCDEAVISVPVQFDPKSKDTAEFNFVTDFYKVEAKRPGGPQEGGFWGAGTGIPFPIDRRGATAIGSEITRLMRKITEPELSRLVMDNRSAEKSEKARYAQYQERSRRMSLVPDPYYKHLEGGTWVLEKIELRDRKEGYLVLEDMRSTLWKDDKSPAIYGGRVPEDFRVERKKDGKNWNVVMGSRVIFDISDNSIIHVALAAPVHLAKDTMVGVLSPKLGLADYKDYFSVGYFRRLSDSPKELSKPKSIARPAIPEQKGKAFEKQQAYLKYVDAQLKGNWYLQRFDVREASGQIKQGCIYDPLSKGHNSITKTLLPSRLEFTGDAKVKVENKDTVAYEVVDGGDEIFWVKAKDTTLPVHGLTYFGRESNELRLAIPFNDGTNLVLTYGPNPISAPQFETQATIMSFYAAHDRTASYQADVETRRETAARRFNAALEQWSRNPNRQVEIPLWIAPIIDLSSNRREVRYGDMNRLREHFIFLEWNEKTELAFLIEMALR